MLTDLRNLDRTDYNLSEIAVYSVSSEDGRVSYTLNGRLNSGFVFMCSNFHVFYENDNEIRLDAGEILFLPKNSRYYHTARRCPENMDDITIYVVNFQLTDPEGKDIVLSHRPEKITTSVFPKLLSITQSMYDEYYRGVYSSSALKSLLYKLFGEICSGMRTEAEKPLHYKIIRNAVDYLSDSHISQINVDALAQMCFISPNAFRRHFKGCFGVNPHEYINSIRMERAISLVRTGSLTVSEISDMLGYNNTSNFVNAFKKYTGRSPGHY
ncbi:MAG: helix-turn-helix domain-containing protein [Eubacteriales bacterium]